MMNIHDFLDTYYVTLIKHPELKMHTVGIAIDANASVDEIEEALLECVRNYIKNLQKDRIAIYSEDGKEETCSNCLHLCESSPGEHMCTKCLYNVNLPARAWCSHWEPKK